MQATQTSTLGPEVREFLRALASEGRQQVLMLFADHSELGVGRVAELAGVAQSTASQQLAELRRGGLLTSRRDGKAVLYRADVTGITRALNALQVHLRSCCPT